jgi:hypothetical protein
VGVVTYCDELRVDKAKRTEVDVGYYCDELMDSSDNEEDFIVYIFECVLLKNKL